MMFSENVKYIDSFPSPSQGRFDKDQWLHDHGKSSVIINCHSKQIYYPDHWTPLSMKCAFNGREYYQSGKAIQCASDDYFLVYNEGKEYTSFIHSDSEVESFTINFSEQFVNNTLKGIFSGAAENLDDPFSVKKARNIQFNERAYLYSDPLKRQVQALHQLTRAFEQNQERIPELLHGLLESLVNNQENIHLEMNGLDAVKAGTRAELYKRLYIAKDLLDSSYQNNISLDELAAAALLNPYYLLRLFKSFFRTTPYQYLKARRIEEAKKLLRNRKHNVSEVCTLVGFSDLSSFSKLFKRETGCSPSQF